MYIIIAILIFGVLVATHELGHFLAAKACGVKVNEFALGMGPRILKKQGKETLYSLRLLPLGGFCAMEGEDGDSEDPRAFTSKPAWQRIIILCAGAAMNFLLGFVLILCIAPNASFTEPIISDFMPGCPYEGEAGLQVGDIKVTRKYGWDYLWVRYADKIAEGGKNVVKKPVGVYVEMVYPEGDFGNLGIGN